MKKDNLIPIIVIGLSVAFIFISIMVFLSNGNAKWIKQKLRIGALILSFTALLNGCQNDENVVTCYLVGPPSSNTVYFENFDSNTIKVKISESREILGTISNPSSENYSYSIIDTLNNEICKDKIVADDLFFNEEVEKFTIILKENIEKGDFRLILFKCKLADQSEEFKLLTYRIIISD